MKPCLFFVSGSFQATKAASKETQLITTEGSIGLNTLKYRIKGASTPPRRAAAEVEPTAVALRFVGKSSEVNLNKIQKLR